MKLEDMKIEFDPDEKYVDENLQLRASAKNALHAMVNTQGWEVLKLLIEQDRAVYLLSAAVPLHEGLSQGYSLDSLAVMRDAHLAKRKALTELLDKVMTLVEQVKEQENKKKG